MNPSNGIIQIATYRLDKSTLLTVSFTCVGSVLQLTIVDRKFGTQRGLERTCLHGKGLVRTNLQLMLLKLKAEAPDYAASIAHLTQHIVDDIMAWLRESRTEYCGTFF